MRLLIMGPPGAGKGTQAIKIAEHYGIPAISTGDIFRALQTADTPLARQVRAIMESDEYVSDEITNEIVADRLAKPLDAILSEPTPPPAASISAAEAATIDGITEPDLYRFRYTSDQQGGVLLVFDPLVGQ